MEGNECTQCIAGAGSSHVGLEAGRSNWLVSKWSLC